MHALGGRSKVAEVSFAAANGRNGIAPMKTKNGMETYVRTKVLCGMVSRRAVRHWNGTVLVRLCHLTSVSLCM